MLFLFIIRQNRSFELEHYVIIKDTTPYVAFPVLEEFNWLTHGCSTRLGGVSSGIHATMNLGFQNGDIPENVYENYNRICAAIGVNPESVVHAKQTHKDRVRVVTTEDRGKGYNRERDYDPPGKRTNCGFRSAITSARSLRSPFLRPMKVFCGKREMKSILIVPS